MPPTVKITKKEIIDAALSIVRESGKRSLTARNIAKRLNCSTRPVYSSFKNMEELEKELILKAADFAQERYLKKKNCETNFLSIGSGYIDLSVEDGELFKYIYLSGNVEIGPDNSFWPIVNNDLIELMKEEEQLMQFDEISLKRILARMWIFTHGLATLNVSNPGLFSRDLIHNQMDEMGQTVIEWEILDKERIRK